MPIRFSLFKAALIVITITLCGCGEKSQQLDESNAAATQMATSKYGTRVSYLA